MSDIADRATSKGSEIQQDDRPTHLRPLVVDLDETLLRTDLLVETAFAFLAKRPLEAFRLIGWLGRGKAHLKAQIAKVVDIDPATLPYSPVVLERLNAARAAGRPLYLASASDERYVRAVAEHLGVFDGWFASDGQRNLSGEAKADLLAAQFGEGGFDYIGDSRADLKVWSRAAGRLAINASPPVRLALNALGGDVEILPPNPKSRSTGRLYLKLIRPHQWVKNGLVLVPMMTAHAFSLLAVERALIAFAAFSMCASSVYIVNDLLDIGADRGHRSKRFRPFAAGELAPLNGLALAAVLLAGAVGLALALPKPFAAVLAAYYIATSAYSFVLKRKMMIDVVTLAGLYAVRVVGGAAAVAVPISEWLLAFAMFIFLCLALVKRHSEMAVRLDASLADPSNRDYRVTDLPVLISLSASSGYAAVIVCALYFSSPAVHGIYSHPRWLFLICPLLLYWVSRVLMLSHRRAMDDDPIVFALKDRISLVTLVLVGLVAVAAI